MTLESRLRSKDSITVGIPEKKLREHAAMKKIILDAAYELYSEKGLDFTTIRKIAEKIDYSPTTVYLYYPSKDMIFYDMQKLAFENLLATLQSVDEHKNAFNRLNILGKTYIDFGVQNPQKYDLMFILHSPMNSIQLNQPWGNFQETFQFMQSIINECIAKKIIIYTDPLTTSLQCWGFLHGLISLYLKKRFSNLSCAGQHNLNPIYQAWNEYIGCISVASGYNNGEIKA